MSLFKKLSAISITSLFISMPVFANLPNNIEPAINPPSVNQPNFNPPSVEPENVPVLNERLLANTIDIVHEKLGNLYDIDWIFDLTIDQKGDLSFNISFDRDSLDSYLDLNDQKIEALIQDACKIIQGKLSTYYPINGYVNDTNGYFFHFSFKDRILKLEKILLHWYQRNDVLELLEDKLTDSLDMNWYFGLDADTSNIILKLYFEGIDYFDTFRYLEEDEILDFIKQSYYIVSNYIETVNQIETDEIKIEGHISDNYYNLWATSKFIKLYEFYIAEEKIELEKLAIDNSTIRSSYNRDYAVKELENELSQYFDMDWQFDIKNEDGYLLFEVGFDNDKSLSTYKGLHSSRIMTFLGQAYEIITTEAQTNYLLIKGTIIDHANATDLAEFTLTYDKIDFKPLAE